MVNDPAFPGGITGVVVADTGPTSPETVPEPASVTLLGAALGTIAFARRRLTPPRGISRGRQTL